MTPINRIIAHEHTRGSRPTCLSRDGPPSTGPTRRRTPTSPMKIRGGALAVAAAVAVRAGCAVRFKARRLLSTHSTIHL